MGIQKEFERYSTGEIAGSAAGFEKLGLCSEKIISFGSSMAADRCLRGRQTQIKSGVARRECKNLCPKIRDRCDTEFETEYEPELRKRNGYKGVQTTGRETCKAISIYMWINSFTRV